MNGCDDYLILSLKHSKDQDWLVWYKPNAIGYTADIARAGRFSREYAAKHTKEGVTAAIPLAAAMRFAERRIMVHETRLDDMVRAANVNLVA